MNNSPQGFSCNPDLRFLYFWPDKDFPDIPLEKYDERTAVLLKDICYVDLLGRRHWARRGEIMNGGDIPRFLWDTIGSPFTFCLVAYIIHDHYCAHAADLPIPERRALRTQGDLILKEIIEFIDRTCANIEISGAKQDAIYAGVRVGTWHACRE